MPFPICVLQNCRASGRRSKSFFHAHESFEEASIIQKDLSSKWTDQCQSTHSEGDLESNNQMNLRHNTWFQIIKLLNPKPPSSLGRQTVDHATFAMPFFSIVPDHKNREQRDSMSLIQLFGRMNVEHQKLTVPKITVLSQLNSASEREKLCRPRLKAHGDLGHQGRIF